MHVSIVSLRTSYPVQDVLVFQTQDAGIEGIYAALPGHGG